MTWNKHRKFNRRGGWENLGPMIAMMAASGGKWEADFGGWDEDGPGGGGRRHGRKRRGRMFGQGELRLALLALIAEEERHGYELIKAIEDMTGGSYAPSPGAVYPTLQMLADEGKITEAKSKDAKKPFKATDEGTAELEERADEVEALMARLGKHGERAEKVRSPDLFRAMGNLATVLKNRARTGTLDKKVMDEIVDIIDEVAKRIERI
ncbi:PadR family transcriptional regulator [uncultured Erythrobacter sp.]|uniref:PadR family transcriptional regulator n=1 Tax=uncultured Erythrobacter sp. TaxID=263913 RepID=UPI00262BA8D3|nr:PadR family transcriptional regulator [uncultured Erythrobacter sp.]